MSNFFLLTTRVGKKLDRSGGLSFHLRIGTRKSPYKNQELFTCTAQVLVGLAMYDSKRTGLANSLAYLSRRLL
jgi:hypothetical protein